MSRSDPQIQVTCNGNCGDIITVGMTPLARGAFDERNVNANLKRDGWISTGENDYCPTCASERELT
jgi:hypothetical protein